MKAWSYHAVPGFLRFFAEVMKGFTYGPVKFPIIFLRNNDVAINSRPTYSEAMDHSHENQIWNRAARDGGGPTPRKGDTMLASLLRVHGMIMSSGIEHALDTLTQQQYKAGVEGYRYFGLLGAAIVLEQARIKRITKNIDLEQFNENYEGLVPGDDALFRALQVKLLASPEDFCPLES